jgi:hypothetical protein
VGAREVLSDGKEVPMRWLHWLSKRARARAANRSREMLRRRRLFLEPLEIRAMRAGDTAEDPRQMLNVIDSTTVEQFYDA